MSRTWQDNADELREMDEGEGWPFARLVAISVVNNGQGGDRRSSNRARDLKASAAEFAKRWDTSTDRVLRFLAGWAKAAEQGLVKRAEDLTPEDVDTPVPTDPEHSWLVKNNLRFYDTKKKPTGGRPRASAKEIVDAITTRPEFADQVLSDPAVQATIVDRVSSDPAATIEVMEQAATKRPAPPTPVRPRGDATAITSLADLNEWVSELHANAPELVADMNAGAVDRELVLRALRKAKVDLDMITIAASGTGDIDSELADMLGAL
jgi:hypothetical protein